MSGALKVVRVDFVCDDLPVTNGYWHARCAVPEQVGYVPVAIAGFRGPNGMTPVALAYIESDYINLQGYSTMEVREGKLLVDVLFARAHSVA